MDLPLPPLPPQKELHEQVIEALNTRKQQQKQQAEENSFRRNVKECAKGNPYACKEVAKDTVRTAVKIGAGEAVSEVVAEPALGLFAKWLKR